MTQNDDGTLKDAKLLVSHPTSGHLGGEVLTMTVDGEDYALLPETAKAFLRNLSTSVGCLEDADADVYTDINRMISEDRR